MLPVARGFEHLPVLTRDWSDRTVFTTRIIAGLDLPYPWVREKTAAFLSHLPCVLCPESVLAKGRVLQQVFRSKTTTRFLSLAVFYRVCFAARRSPMRRNGFTTLARRSRTSTTLSKAMMTLSQQACRKAHFGDNFNTGVVKQKRSIYQDTLGTNV